MKATLNILLLALLLFACEKEAPVDLRAEDSAVLVDASRDGGAWWFPQSSETGFSMSEPHQGKQLADYIRSRGFEVVELPRGRAVTDGLLNQYNKIIRLFSFLF